MSNQRTIFCGNLTLDYLSQSGGRSTERARAAVGEDPSCWRFGSWGREPTRDCALTR